jgi:ABC-type sugar transport system permease subunit
MAVVSFGSNRNSRAHTAGFYLTQAPFFLVLFTFSVFPVAFSFYLGFQRWDGFSQPSFIGFSNYERVLADPVFVRAAWNTAYLWFWSTLLTVGLALALAVLIDAYVVAARGYLRMVFLLPLLVAPAVAAVILQLFFGANGGLASVIANALFGAPLYFNWTASEVWIKPLVVMLIVWRWTGWHLVILLAGLQAIPRDIYEAARMDGVGRWKTFQHITLPLLAPALAFSLMTSAVGGLQLFDEPFVLTQGAGGTNNSATTLGMYLYRTAFAEFNFGTGAAISWYIFLAVVVISLAIRTLQQRADFRREQ